VDALELFKDAKKELNLADHIFFVALPVVQDKNVFLSILEHLNKCVMLAMKAYLLAQKKMKKLRIIPESEDLTRRLFFEEFMKELNIVTSEKHLVNEIIQVTRAYRKSQAEIKRGEDYVLFLPNFDTVVINEKSMKRYLSIARSFINKIEKGMPSWNSTSLRR